VATVQFRGDQKSALENHRIVSLDRQRDPLEPGKVIVSRESPVTLVNLRPSTDRNVKSVESIGPRVFKVRGWKMWEDDRDEYFADFLVAACSAAPPRLADIDKKTYLTSSKMPFTDKDGHLAKSFSNGKT